MRIVVLTGAGISAESGVKTFRGEDGLWEGHPIEEVATPEAFHRNPDLVYEFYNQRRAQLLDPNLQPNKAHLALFELEKRLGDDFLLVTQNVDNLHERAGNKNIIHMHGELQRIRCLQTGESFFWQENLDSNTPHPKGLKATLRPDIVWFGEMPKEMDTIQEALFKADLFLCIGTSGVVYPAAGFVQLTSKECHTIEFNVEGTAISDLFNETIVGPSGETLDQWVRDFLKKN